ncbi:MAG: hypothetical protein LUH07_14135, partial [Lachnospiraceae bacterium]|nr:hypothetical protein [Lachnospiraceae bacterium]
MGVTRRCEHMAQYSITGCRKRDYPPVFQYQTTWWKDFHLMEDYFARLSMCVQTGEVVRDILVLHPITSVWTQCGSDPKEDLGRVHMNMGWLDKHILDLNIWGEQYNRLARLLLGAHLDFDFGDETLLAQIGAAEDGKLKVGKCSYSTVIVPGVLSLFESTVKLLEQFVKTGGHLIWVGEFPDLLEGRRSSLIQDTFSLCPVHRAKFFEELPQILRECQEPSVCVQAKEGGEDTSILTMLRRTEDGYLLLAINNDRHREHPVRFSLRMTGRTEAYDPWTDSRREVSVRRTNTGMCFIEELAPAGSMVYYICTKERPSEGKADFPYRHPHDEEAVLAALGPEASFSRTMPNVLTLDCCRYALSTDSLSEEMEVWQAQKEIRERLS